ncbi:tyrosine-type recombinase/integrase [Vibrio astriarenae]
MYPLGKRMGQLHDKKLRALLNKPRDEMLILTDGEGLSVRVSPKGKIRWQYRYKIQGQSKRLDIGYYDEISIARARAIAQQYRAWLAEGYDPKLKRKLELEDKLRPVTVKDALGYWITEYAEKKRKNVDKSRAQFERHIYPHIGDLPLEEVDTRLWVECFDRITNGVIGKQRPAPKASAYIFQAAKQALRFCRVRQYATSRALDDLNGTDVGEKQNKKDTVLNDQMLVDVWNLTSSDRFLPYYCNLIKMLVVYGARTQEVRLSRWCEWDFEKDIWTIPKAHSKTAKEIVRPVPTHLRDWLLKLKGEAKADDYILGELKRPEAVSQFGRNLWKRLGHDYPWTLHDLRRTLITGLGDLRVPPHIVKKMLAHSMGEVLDIYNRSEYMEERKEAHDMWIERLELLSVGTDNTVVVNFARA